LCGGLLAEILWQLKRARLCRFCRKATRNLEKMPREKGWAAWRHSKISKKIETFDLPVMNSADRTAKVRLTCLKTLFIIGRCVARQRRNTRTKLQGCTFGFGSHVDGAANAKATTPSNGRAETDYFGESNVAPTPTLS
jgi:hypothetical protein